MRNNDEIMKRIADGYVERYGSELRAELEQLEQAPMASIPEISLERRVRRKIAALRRRPYLRALPMVAACIVIAVIYLPNLLNSGVSKSSTHEPSLAAPTAPSSRIPSESAHTEQSAPATAAPAPEAQVYEAIPLSAPLPRGFTLTGFDQDREKSIYYIEDANLDDVVVTLEPAGAPPDTTGLVEIILGGSVVYGRQTDAFSLLTFSSGDVLYTLTSRHDINTLLRLGNAFV